MPLKIDSKEKQILKSVQIPPRPEALLKVQQEAKQPEPDFSVISKAIVSDVSISAAVLQIVNSAAFKRAQSVSSIDQALMMLGLKRVVSIANAVAIRNAAGGDSDKLQEFWDTASTVASAGVLFTKVIGRTALSDDAYTLGLFHLSGVPLMLQSFDDYMDFYHAADEEGWGIAIEKERAKYQTTHTTIAAILGFEWKLPMHLIEAIYNLHYADGIFDSDEWSDEMKTILAILICAREITHRHMLGEASTDWEEMQDQILTYLDIDEAVLSNAMIDVQADLQQGDAAG